MKILALILTLFSPPLYAQIIYHIEEDSATYTVKNEVILSVSWKRNRMSVYYTESDYVRISSEKFSKIIALMDKARRESKDNQPAKR